MAYHAKKKSTAMKKKRVPIRRRKAFKGRRIGRPITTNTAAIRENYSVTLNDGTMNYFSVALGNTVFNRAQAVAQNFQEYRIKYVKLTFKPSADTFPLAAGNTIPQLYFQMNKYQAIPSGASLAQLLDMGCRPIRFDDKNITRAWKPCVLLSADNTALGTAAPAQVKVTPWLSTNNAAGDPVSWVASAVEHLGCVFFVTKANPATPTVPYVVDVEVVFQYRRPLSLLEEPSNTPMATIKGAAVTQV